MAVIKCRSSASSDLVQLQRHEYGDIAGVGKVTATLRVAQGRHVETLRDLRKYLFAGCRTPVYLGHTGSLESFGEPNADTAQLIGFKAGQPSDRPSLHLHPHSSTLRARPSRLLVHFPVVFALDAFPSVDGVELTIQRRPETPNAAEDEALSRVLRVYMVPAL